MTSGLIGATGRILMIGALSIRFVRDNWVEPLRGAYDAAFVDVSPLRNVYSRDVVEQYLYRIIQHGGFSRLFFYSEAVQAEFSDAFFNRVRAAGLTVIVFHADDDPEVWYRQNAAYDHRYDVIYSPSRLGVDRRRRLGCQACVEYLPWGYNPTLFHPARYPPSDLSGAIAHSSLGKRYDVVFVGANMSQPNNPEHYLREGWDRQLTLVELDGICQRHGIDFALFGYGWDHHPTLHRRHRGFPDQEELVRIYQQARIVVNTGFSADGEGRPQTKLRHFEVAGSGAFQLVNDNSELRELFEPGREMVFYRDTPDLKAKLLYYLEHPEEREVIAAAAERRARREHTQPRRVATMFGPPPRQPPAQPRVEQLLAPATEAELKRLEAQLAAGDFRHATALWFLDSALEALACELTVLNPGWDQAPVAAWGVRTFVQLARLHGNRLHRRKQDIRGLVLHERVDKTRYHPRLLDMLRANLSCLEDTECLYPLCNLLIRPNQAATVLRAYRGGDLDALRALDPLPTSRLVNDVILTTQDASFLTEASYLQPLRELLALIARTGETLLIYGAQGEMVDQITPLLAEATAVRLLGFADRQLAGKRLRQWEICAPEAIELLQPELILIAAETSGPAISRDLSAHQGRSTLVPLYDLAAPVWTVLLP